MTALDERPATTPAATAADLATFRAAQAAYVAEHRHARHAAHQTADAQLAGLTAVLADRDRHPVTFVQDGLQVTDDKELCATLQRHGWLLVGLGTHRLTGDILYVLERAEQGGAA